MLHAFCSWLGSRNCIKEFFHVYEDFIFVALHFLADLEHTSGDRPLSFCDIRGLEYFNFGVIQFKKVLLHWHVREKEKQMPFFILLQI